MDLLNETVLLKTKRTLFNLLVKETSQFLCYERLLNMTNVAYKKCIFQRNAILVALLYSGFISSTILTISIKNFSRIPFGCKKCVFLHDTRLWFPDYMTLAFWLQKPLLSYTHYMQSLCLIWTHSKEFALQAIRQILSMFDLDFDSKVISAI